MPWTLSPRWSLHQEVKSIALCFNLFVSGCRQRTVGDGGALARARLFRQLADGHSGERGGLIDDCTAALQITHRAA